ncbi:MAG TPA: hypothetical protein DIU07_13155 [Rhodobacteraceae bacterium]|nr:hypothetical protein [Paracoccaceae bacterium]
MKATDRVFAQVPVRVCCQIVVHPHRQGIVAGCHRARRLMAGTGLEAIRKRRGAREVLPTRL